MGNQKLKWTQEEEDALIAGIDKHGTGKWKTILVDPQFAHLLTSRSNIDLKDKWRNMNVYVNGSQGSSSRTPKPKAAPASSGAVPQISAPSSDIVASDPSPNEPEVKNPPRYNAMVFDALSTLKDTNGSDLNAIASFIEQKHQVPQNFRRALSSRLRTLVNQGKVEKVQNCYKIKKDAPLVTKTPSPSPKQKDVRPQLQSSVSDDMLKKAADTAAYIIAEAENKSYLASEAVKETERFARLAEENDAVLLLAEKLYEQCLRGETFKWA